MGVKVKEGDLIKIEYEDEQSGETMELVVEIVQIMEKLLVKEPDQHSYLDGGHRPFLIEDEDILEVVKPAEDGG